MGQETVFLTWNNNCSNLFRQDLQDKQDINNPVNPVYPVKKYKALI